MQFNKSCFAMMLALTCACFAQVGGGGARGFQGPSILSRGFGTTGRSAGAPLAFTPYFSASSFYRTGLTAAATDTEGNFFDRSDYGMQASLGAYLRHLGNHKTINLDYRTHMRYHARHAYHFGNDHFLGLSYSQQVSPRVSYFLRQSASTFSSAFGNSFGSLDGSFNSSLGFGFSNQNFLLSDPLSQVFDTRIFGLSSGAGMVYQLSARLSIGMSGGYHMARYHSNSLVGSQGYLGSGNISYNLSERSTIGVHYGFGHNTFRNSYGQTDSHQVGMHYSRALNERWHFGVGVGMFRVEANRLRPTQLDPLAALLLGQSTQLTPFYNKHHGLGGTVSVGRSFQNSSLGFNYSRATTPGNGVVVGAISESVGMSHSFTAAQRLAISSQVHYSRHKSLFDNAQFRGYGLGSGTSYRLFSIVSASVRVDYRHFELRNTAFSRNQLNISGGLSFAYSPGEIPLSIW